MDDQLKILPIMSLLILMIVATCGNFILILSVATEKALRTVPNMMILALSVADFLVGVVIVPFNLINLIDESLLANNAFCKFLGFINVFLLVMSVMSLANISLNRFCAICHPILYRTLYTMKKSMAMVFLSVAVSLLLASPPLFGWCRFRYLDNQGFCFVDWKQSQSYTTFMISVCFGFPCSCMTYCYFKIVVEVRTSRRRVKVNLQKMDRLDVPSVSRSLNENTIKENESTDKELDLKVASRRSQNHSAEIKKKKRRLKDIHLSLTLFVIVLLFVLCWLPYCIVMLITTFSKMEISYVVWNIVLFAGFANSCCNPIAYGLISKDIRNGYQNLFEKLTCTT